MKLILGSKSPRRQELLKEMGYSFEIRTKDTDESFSSDLSPDEVVKFISEKKAQALINELGKDELLLTSDTIVCVDDKILGKPVDRDEAIEMLELLSGRKHKVLTGVTIATKNFIHSEVCNTDVTVKQLSKAEIIHYVDTCKPFDKAGSYGIQEWFGAAAIEGIVGSYNNVVGLPTHLVYDLLKRFEFQKH